MMVRERAKSRSGERGPAMPLRRTASRTRSGELRSGRRAGAGARGEARSAEAVARPWGKASRRRAARRQARYRGEPRDGSGAPEARRREVRVFAVRTGKRSERERASASGIVTGTAKTAQRASWSRAGRSRARRNRARRPVRRTGRAPQPSDRGKDDGRPSSATMEDSPQATGFGVCPTRAATDEHGGGDRCGFAKKGRLGPVRWRRAKRGGEAVRRTGSGRAEEGETADEEGKPASARRRRECAEPVARTGRVARCGMAPPGARAALARSAAPRCATPGTEHTKGDPSP